MTRRRLTWLVIAMAIVELALIAGMVSIAVQAHGDLSVLRPWSGRGGTSQVPAWAQIGGIGVFALLWGSFSVVVTRRGVERLRRDP